VLFILPRISSIPSGSPSLAGAKNALQAAKETGARTVEIWVNASGQLDFKVILEGNAPRRQPTSTDAGDPSPQDIALVLHTSGTTGRPKSVPLTHHNLVTTTRNVVNTYSLTEKDRSYLVMPLFHVHGLLAGLLSPLRSGGSIVMPERFSAGKFWEDFTTTKCTWYTAGMLKNYQELCRPLRVKPLPFTVPTIHTILLNSPRPSPIPPIRFVRSCSSALPPIIHERLEKTFNAPVLEVGSLCRLIHISPHPLDLRPML
jgi:oxalate---CoA ligase